MDERDLRDLIDRVKAGGLSRRGFVIYPGKLTVADSFRIGCIGRLGEHEMRGVLRAIGEILAETGVGSCAPARR